MSQKKTSYIGTLGDADEDHLTGLNYKIKQPPNPTEARQTSGSSLASRCIKAEFTTCQKCFVPSVCLVVDNSEGEYTAVAICRCCIQKLFI